MPTTIKLKNSVTTTNAPSSLAQGEVAINVTDKKVWVGNAATTPVQLLGTGAAGNFSALTCTTLNASGVVTFTNLTASQAVFTDASDNLVSNAITGTGSVVMSASPTLTGTITAAAITASGNIVGNGNWTLGNADTDTITVGASFVTGSVLRSAKTATNTLALAAYDVDGDAYTNLITLTASNTPTLTLTSTGVGTINNMSVGATTASTGAFTTLSASGVASFADGTVSLPSITNIGDTNTGIFFPAADTIAFTEGGTEVIRINSSGNVGVGTTTPSSKLDVNGTITATSLNSQNTFGFKNRIINGAMVIDQRNAGASVTANDGVFAVDRFRFSMTQSSKGTGQQSSVAPAGFVNSLLFTSTASTSLGSSDEFAIIQPIEGLNISDLGWGTASAQTVTLSFWVRSSLTGTFGGSLQNSAANRSYPYSYTISSANTWEQKSVTIVGDTTGTWLTTNGMGIRLRFGLGVGSTGSGTAGAWSASNLSSATGAVSVVGTNGATFYITGVQLEKGSTATSFDYRPYTTELSLCQRYYVDLANNGGSTQNTFRAIGFGSTYNTTAGTYVVQVPVPMRVVPSLTQAGTMYLQNLGATSISSFAGPYSIAGTIVEGDFNMVGAVAANAPGILRWNNSATQKFAYSAEL
jgi:hypothetical protein